MTSQERHKVPIEEKESYKWLAALSETVKWQPEGTRLITVGDSEADILIRPNGNEITLWSHFAHAFNRPTPLTKRGGGLII
ncbi:MAG: hypothetical protein R3C14_02865 [Caldilineaceae bacterium]